MDTQLSGTGLRAITASQWLMAGHQDVLGSRLDEPALMSLDYDIDGNPDDGFIVSSN